MRSAPAPTDLDRLWARIRAACCDESAVNVDEHAWFVCLAVIAAKRRDARA